MSVVKIFTGHSGIQYSIVIPTYRRYHDLRACLHGIARLDFPRDDFEVIVVDDGSPDPPTQIVDAFTDQLQCRLVILPNNGGPARARNAGARHATGKYLVFLDDDCIPERDWLASLQIRQTQRPGAVIGGILTNGAPHSVCAEASQQLTNFLYRYYNHDPDNAGWFVTASLACPREPFIALGGFDESFPLAAAEDRDFCDRWREQGSPLVLAPHAVVQHMRTMNFSQFWRQHRTYGRGAHHLHLARARRHATLPQREPVSFYVKLLCAPLTSPLTIRTPVLMTLMMVSQFAYARGFYLERRR